MAKQRELGEIKEARRIVRCQTTPWRQKEPEWWKRRFAKNWRSKKLGNQCRKESGREVPKEKPSEEENLSKVEFSTQEVDEEVASEEKGIPTVGTLVESSEKLDKEKHKIRTSVCV